jgi:hypothetical protein
MSCTTLNYTDTGLNEGRNYWYKVSASNEVGEGVKSATIQVTQESDNIVLYFAIGIISVAIIAILAIVLLKGRK